MVMTTQVTLDDSVTKVSAIGLCCIPLAENVYVGIDQAWRQVHNETGRVHPPRRERNRANRKVLVCYGSRASYRNGEMGRKVSEREEDTA